jgi:hypothetical protein
MVIVMREVFNIEPPLMVVTETATSDRMPDKTLVTQAGVPHIYERIEKRYGIAGNWKLIRGPLTCANYYSAAFGMDLAEFMAVTDDYLEEIYPSWALGWVHSMLC